MLTFLCQCVTFLCMKSPASVCGVIMIEQNLRTECSASTTVGLGAVASALYVIAFRLAFVMPWPEDPVCAKRCCAEEEVVNPMWICNLQSPTETTATAKAEIALTENDDEEKEKVVVEK